MARELIAGGGGRNVWRALKRAVVESLQPVPPRHHQYPIGGNAPQQLQTKIWNGGVLSSAQAEMMTMTTRGSSSTAAGAATGRWRDFAAQRSNPSEGLSSLLSPLSYRRPDATMIQRSAAAVRRRCSQLIGLEIKGTSTAFSTGGVRTVQYSARSVVKSPSTSSLVKSQMKMQGRLAVMTTTSAAAARRNLSSSSGTTWTERWNTLRKSFSPKQQPKGGGGSAASVGLKSVSQGRQVLSEVTSPLRKTFTHYREAVGLQIEAFWKRNYLVVVGIVGLGICLLLWRLMFGIASTFISMSEGLAKFGFLALAAAMVIVGGVVLRARFTINPDAVYRIAMRKLNTSAAVLEVMGAPLSGSDLRAYIMSGGGIRVKKLRPRIAGKRCFIIFPIQGSDHRGLVSVEVKKRKGQYNFKLLAVDVPAAGADQRLYLIGDEKEYKIGGGLMHELRDPIVKAMAAQKELEEIDMKEEEDDEREAMEAEQRRAQQEELDRLAKEKEAQEQDELEKSKKEESLALDEVEKSNKHEGKDANPLRAQAG